jgi:hypothetical protein
VNIFVLDLDPARAAEYHCDKHLVKMPIEYAQMLCTAIHLDCDSRGIERPDGIYKPSHISHPCSLWARRSRDNWLWLQLLALEVGKQYNRCYGRWHMSTILTHELECPDLPRIGLTEFALAMPEDCKVHDNAVDNYRQYYQSHKADIATWRTRTRPHWMPFQ